MGLKLVCLGNLESGEHARLVRNVYYCFFSPSGWDHMVSVTCRLEQSPNRIWLLSFLLITSRLRCAGKLLTDMTARKREPGSRRALAQGDVPMSYPALLGWKGQTGVSVAGG